MSLRSIISAVLRGIARMVVVTSEAIINGVRTIVTSLIPARNLESSELADAYISEEQTPPVMPVAATATRLRPSEAERVRQAAVELRAGRRIQPSLLDPQKSAELEVLGWLADRDDLQLGMIARAGDDDISRHLDGEKRLRMPLLPAAEARAEELREARRPANTEQWMRELMRLEAENGNDDPDVDSLLAEAQRLADAGCCIADYPISAPAADQTEGVINDCEDVG